MDIILGIVEKLGEVKSNIGDTEFITIVILELSKVKVSKSVSKRVKLHKSVDFQEILWINLLDLAETDFLVTL